MLKKVSPRHFFFSSSTGRVHKNTPRVALLADKITEKPRPRPKQKNYGNGLIERFVAPYLYVVDRLGTVLRGSGRGQELAASPAPYGDPQQGSPAKAQEESRGMRGQREGTFFFYGLLKPE